MREFRDKAYRAIADRVIKNKVFRVEVEGGEGLAVSTRSHYGYVQ